MLPGFVTSIESRKPFYLNLVSTELVNVLLRCLPIRSLQGLEQIFMGSYVGTEVCHGCTEAGTSR